jgi:hypothetical protein
MGHGIHTHAHETRYDIANVRERLIDAGLDDNIIANGGWLQDGPNGLGWVDYISSFKRPNGQLAFQAATAYKDPRTQQSDTSKICFRPSLRGDWHIHDPNGDLVYIGSSALPGYKSNKLDFATIAGRIDDRLSNMVPGKINTLYWHNSADGYGNNQGPLQIQKWDSLLTAYFDPLAAQGKIVWANFTEIYDIYLQWENSLAISNEKSSLNRINIFPNPVRNQMNIYLGNINSNDDLTLRLFDLSGRLVSCENIEPNGEFWQVSTKRLRPSIYLLHIDPVGISERVVIIN